MLFPKNEDWEAWGIIRDHHKFICLRWEEIFSEETYDSWQVRTVNFEYILYEMLDAVETTLSYQPFHKNIELLIGEARHSCKLDPIITKHFPHAEDYLSKLEQCYKNRVKSGNRPSILEFRKLLFVILEYIRDYKDLLIKRINNLILDPQGGDNIELYKLTMALGVVLKTEGYSISSLRDSFDILIDNSIPNFEDRFNKLISVFSSKEIEYECSFHVILAREEIDLSSYGITFHSNRPDGPLAEPETQFFDQDRDSYRISIKIKALDPYSARAKAEHALENVFAAYNLYQPNRYPKFKHKFSLIISEAGDQFCLEKDDSRLKYIRDSKKPAKSVSTLIRLVGGMPEDNSGRLTASLQYHRLAMNAHTDEARLVNLWIAMESLIQADQGSIIDNICRYIPTSLGLEYVRETIKNLAISMRSVWRYSDKTELLELLQFSDNFRLHQVDLLGILVDGPQSEKVNLFSAIISEAHLLRYRFFSLYKNMFKSPQKLANQISTHRMNIEWQICRIYRVRNYIMHIGVCPPRIRQLIQHLHSYYILLIHGLLHDMRNHNEWGVEHAIENRLLLYDMFMSRLNNNDQDPLTVEELLYPDEILVQRTETERRPAWPPAEAPE